MTEVKLTPLENNDREQFITDNQTAFNYGALEEFGTRDEHFEEDNRLPRKLKLFIQKDKGTKFKDRISTHIRKSKNQFPRKPNNVISRETINKSIDSGTAYRIMLDGEKVGGAVVSVDGEKGDLELLFVKPECHGKGIGYQAWCEIEKLYPDVKVWETVTPYFEKRNIHFYVNRCGFKIVEFFNKYHGDVNEDDELFEMFRFEKKMIKE